MGLGASEDRSGIAFLISAEVVWAVVAACCSSPQTAEINADKRAATLMKWVYLGLATSALFVGIAAYYDRKHAVPLIAGGVMAGGIMYGYYWHAKTVGLGDGKPGTES